MLTLLSTWLLDLSIVVEAHWPMQHTASRTRPLTGTLIVAAICFPAVCVYVFCMSRQHTYACQHISLELRYSARFWFINGQIRYKILTIYDKKLMQVITRKYICKLNNRDTQMHNKQSLCLSVSSLVCADPLLVLSICVQI